MIDIDALNASTSFAKQALVQKYRSDKTPKLSPFEAYIALIKGYCAMTILMLPKAFANGGWLASLVFLIVSGLLTTLCAIKLA